MDSAADLPAPPSLAELTAQGPVALFLDFDGTLVEIAATPEAIVVPEKLAARLWALSDRLGGRLALVSGRAVANLEEHCGPLGIACAGSHGLSRFSAARERLGEEPRALPPAVLDAIGEFAAAEGFDLETKVHGRRCTIAPIPRSNRAGSPSPLRWRANTGWSSSTASA